MSCTSVLVEVSGPDAKSVKSHYAAFHTSRNGRTTLSCSGLALLPPANSGGATDTFHVLAPLSSIYPFLQQQHRLRLATATQASLLPGASISLRLPTASGELRLVPAALAAVLPLPAARAAAEQLLQSTNDASPGSWRLGWLLAGQQPLEAATPRLLGRIAILTVNISSPDTAAAVAAAAARFGAPQQRGCGRSGSDGRGCLRPGLGVAVTGSPFGCLAPDQFQGAVVTGIVSNLLPGRPPSLDDPAAAGDAALFVVDARVMPGMEGGPIACRGCGRLLGLLGLPLTNNSSRVELMLGISASHVLAAAAAAAAADGEASAGSVCAVIQQLQAVLTPPDCCSSGSNETSSCSSSLSRQPVLSVEPQQRQQDDAPGARSCCHIDSSPCITTAAAAAAAGQAGVVMVRAGRSWGSGVLLTPSGIVMTNAHLLSTPCGGASNSSRDSITSSSSVTPAASIRLSSPGGDSSGWLPARLLHCFQSYLDIALLQVAPDALQQLPPSWHLLPLQLACADAAPGDSVLVVGHGLFGPAVGLSPLGWPAVTAGCAARVVELPAAAAAAPYPQQQQPEKRQQFQQQQGRPSMVISTAAVHAGASGGALIRSADGRLVGLVTSNARHAGGSTLPHCNFSVSAAELRPVWAWAQQQHQLWQQQPGQQHAGGGRRVTGVVGEVALQQLRRLDSQQDGEAGRRL